MKPTTGVERAVQSASAAVVVIVGAVVGLREAGILQREPQEVVARVAPEVAVALRQIDELHRGLAPLDLRPKLTSIERSVDDLSREMRRLNETLRDVGRNAKQLSFELEDASHRAPVEPQASVQEPDPEPRTTTRWEQLKAWWQS